MTDLQTNVDDALIATMTPAAKGAIDRLLACGASREAILTFVRMCAVRGGGTEHALIVQAVEAYLDRKQSETPT